MPTCKQLPDVPCHSLIQYDGNLVTCAQFPMPNHLHITQLPGTSNSCSAVTRRAHCPRGTICLQHTYTKATLVSLNAVMFTSARTPSCICLSFFAAVASNSTACTLSERYLVAISIANIQSF